MLFYLPIALTALATTLYHIAQKSIVPGVHPMVSLVITYATSLVACLVVVPFAPSGATFARSLKDLNWATYVVGLSIVGVEPANPARVSRRLAHQPHLSGRQRRNRTAAGDHRCLRLPGAPRRP